MFGPVFRAIQNKGYKQPTPIQRQVIPMLLDGMDVVAMARTGSGKTASFVIPMVHRLKAHSAKVGARALILAPSRELALQNLQYVKNFCKYTDLRAVALLGGDSLHEQFDGLLTNPDIIVATPGRLIHIIEETKSQLLSSVQMIVLDEADRLFELGLSEQIQQIFKLCAQSGEPRTTALFSATLPGTLIDFATAGLKNPRLIRMDVESQLSPDLETFFFTIKTTDKEAMLLATLLSPASPIQLDMEKQSSVPALDANHVRGGMIFASTRHHVEYLHELLSSVHIPHAYLYGNMDASARRYALSLFRAAQVPILIATDLAARGLDLPHLDWVLHYDFPPKEKLFVHRAGRVARAGRPGKAVAFVTADELPYVIDLHRFLGRTLVLAHAQGDAEEAASGSTMTDVLVGSVPHSVLDEYNERVQNLMHHSSALEALKQVSLNASQLYTKTKAKATPSAYDMAKQAGTAIGTHPQWSSLVPSQEDLLARLRNFRPQETVFEAMRKNVHGQKKDATVALIQKRRELVEKRQSVKPVSSLGKSASVDKAAPKDGQDYYLSYTKSTAAVDSGLAIHHSGDPLSLVTNKSALAMDLFTGNDETGQLAARPRTAQVWDKKAKKFVRVQPTRSSVSSDGQASFFKPKQHAVAPGRGMGDAFTQWRKRRKMASGLPSSGSVETANRSESLFESQKPDYRKGKGGKRFIRPGQAPVERISNLRRAVKKPIGGAPHSAPARNELKRPEQVLKARKDKLKAAERSAQKSKHKKQKRK